MENLTPQFWLSFLQFICNILLGLYIWSSNRQKATVSQINAVAQEVSKLKEDQGSKCSAHLSRTSSIEVKMEKAPTHQDLGEVHEKINKVQRGVDNIAGEMKGLTTNINLLVTHHLKGDN